MSDLEEQVAALRDLVETQSEELGRLRSEVAELRRKPPASGPSGDSTPATASGTTADVVSRRRLLGKAGVAAAAGAAGLLATSQPAAANTGDNMIVGKINDAGSPTALRLMTAHPVALQVFGGGDSFDANALTSTILGYSGPVNKRPALRGYATDSNAVHGQAEKYVGVVGISRDDAGVYGVSTKGAGVVGTSSRYHGVTGEATAPGFSGVYGKTASGAGVVGEATTSLGLYGVATSGVGARGLSSTGNGVEGTSSNGSGVVATSSSTRPALLARANRGYAVDGESTNGTGVLGIGAAYGGDFLGTRAAIRLRQQSFAGKPTTGIHARGELLCDKNGALFFCTSGGTPGTWKKVQLV